MPNNLDIVAHVVMICSIGFLMLGQNVSAALFAFSQALVIIYILFIKEKSANRSTMAGISAGITISAVVMHFFPFFAI